MKTLTIKCGDSFSIWLKLKTGQTFPSNTNMLVYIGGVLIGNLDTGIPLITYESPYYKMNLSSEDTFPMRGYRDVIAVLDGTDGVRQVIIAGILFERLPTDYQTPTTNDGVNMIIELDVSTSPITGSAELIDALKGDKGDPGYGVLPMDGAPGQVVTKLSYTEQDAGWITPIQLGETSADSYRGDRGKIAYDHSQTTHAPADAEKNVNADWNSTSGDSQILNKPIIPSIAGLATTTYVDQQDALKVDKIAGKGLSSNDYTVAEKDKLAAIQAWAQVNILEGVQRNGTNLTIIDKKVNVVVPTTPSEVGAEPANPNIQNHISSTSNPHSVTKTQVGLGNVDNTSDANKPVSTAVQTALNSKQASGTYSTDIHTNITALNAVSGTNTGDETLTSIKTKLGAASSVSDGYLTYNMFNIFNGKEPSFTKNTGFNLPLGNTPGTVLEGRTFGTAANSAVGDFIQNQNSSAQSANMWITGLIKTNAGSGGMSLGGNSSPDEGYLGYNYSNFNGTVINGQPARASWRFKFKNGGGDLFAIDYRAPNAGTDAWSNYFNINSSGVANIPSSAISTSPATGALVVSGGIGAGHVRANNFYGNGSNLIGVQLPITLTTNGTSGAATFENGVMNVPNYGSSTTGGTFGSAYTNVSNTGVLVNPVAFYTNISGIFTASVKISVMSTATGKCIFRVSLPQTPYGYQSIIVQGSDSGKTTNYNIFVDNSGTNYVDIAFIASTSSSSIIVNIMAVGN